MSVEDTEHAVGFVADFDLGICDAGVLHVLTPALHLAGGVFDAVATARLGYLFRLRFAQVHSHPLKNI